MNLASSSPAYGPYDPWNVLALAVNPFSGSDNKRHLLWKRNDGQAGFWRLPSNDALPVPSALEVNSVYGPSAGWTPLTLSIGGDGQIRSLWTHTDGRAAFGKLSPDGNTSPVNVTFGPITEPEVSVVPSSLATPAAGYQYLIPVVIIAYLPTTDNVNLDFSVTGVPSTLDAIKAKIAMMNQQVKFSLEEGSRYHGYKNSSANPALGYKVISLITVREQLPRSSNQLGSTQRYYPDYKQILSRFNAQNFVEQQGVKEFWIWGYDHNDIAPAESKMSSRLTGDISNSYHFNGDLPVFSKTYLLYNYNYGRTSNEAVHDHGHQLEQMLAYTNYRQDGNKDLWEKNFMGKVSSNPDVWTTGRCGWTHMPPNTTMDYDYQNSNPVQSDIEDWTPGRIGQLKSVNAATWGNLNYQWPNGSAPDGKTEGQWYIYWRQNIPSLGNNIAYGTGGDRITNWWQFIGDWDNAITNNIGLHTVGGRSAASSYRSGHHPSAPSS